MPARDSGALDRKRRGHAPSSTPGPPRLQPRDEARGGPSDPPRQPRCGAVRSSRTCLVLHQQAWLERARAEAPPRPEKAKAPQVHGFGQAQRERGSHGAVLLARCMPAAPIGPRDTPASLMRTFEQNCLETGSDLASESSRPHRSKRCRVARRVQDRRSCWMKHLHSMIPTSRPSRTAGRTPIG